MKNNILCAVLIGLCSLKSLSQQDSIVCQCGQGDFNQDGIVNTLDLLIFMGPLWGQTYDCDPSVVDTICDYGDAEVSVVYNPTAFDTLDINNSIPTFGVPVYSFTVTPNGGDIYLTQESVGINDFLGYSLIDSVFIEVHLLQDGVEIAADQDWYLEMDNIQALVNNGTQSTFTITVDLIALDLWPQSALICGDYPCVRTWLVYPELVFQECDGTPIPNSDEIPNGGNNQYWIYFQ